MVSPSAFFASDMQIAGNHDQAGHIAPFHPRVVYPAHSYSAVNSDFEYEVDMCMRANTLECSNASGIIQTNDRHPP